MLRILMLSSVLTATTAVSGKEAAAAQCFLFPGATLGSGQISTLTTVDAGTLVSTPGALRTLV
jgi:hypothetical protein